MTILRAEPQARALAPEEALRSRHGDEGPFGEPPPHPASASVLLAILLPRGETWELHASCGRKSRAAQGDGDQDEGRSAQEVQRGAPLGQRWLRDPESRLSLGLSFLRMNPVNVAFSSGLKSPVITAACTPVGKIESQREKVPRAGEHAGGLAGWTWRNEVNVSVLPEVSLPVPTLGCGDNRGVHGDHPHPSSQLPKSLSAGPSLCPSIRSGLHSVRVHACAYVCVHLCACAHACFRVCACVQACWCTRTAVTSPSQPRALPSPH